MRLPNKGKILCGIDLPTASVSGFPIPCAAGQRRRLMAQTGAKRMREMPMCVAMPKLSHLLGRLRSGDATFICSAQALRGGGGWAWSEGRKAVRIEGRTERHQSARKPLSMPQVMRLTGQWAIGSPGSWAAPGSGVPRQRGCGEWGHISLQRFGHGGANGDTAVDQKAAEGGTFGHRGEHEAPYVKAERPGEGYFPDGSG